jgi:arylsulfatase A-like enzyme
VRLMLTQRIVWDESWKFIYNGFDEDELYHLASDPHELHNLAQVPEHAGTVKRLTAVMWRYVNRTRDRALLGTHYQPMRMAVVGPNAGS